MAIYRKGTFVQGTAGPQSYNLNLGFIPSVLRLTNITKVGVVGAPTAGVTYAYWDDVLGALTAPITTITTTGVVSGVASGTLAATTGVIPFQTADSALFLPNQVPYTTNQSTNLVVTAISQAANAVITATHSFTAADIGVTVVTFHNVVGMTQINTLSGIVQSVTSTTSFTVNINTTNFTAYISGGIANVITGAPVNTLYGNVSLPTSEANLGIIGVRIGTSVITVGTDTWEYEAILQSPATGP